MTSLLRYVSNKTAAPASGQPAKPDPDLDITSAVTVSPASNIQALIDANAVGTVFYFPNDTYNNIHRIRPKQGNRFIGQSETGVISKGTASVGIAFRVLDDDVTIARMTFQNYGTSAGISQDFGVVDFHDNATKTAVESSYVPHLPDEFKSQDSHVAECTFKTNGNVGVFIGIRTSITDCSFLSHSPHGVGGGGGKGGMIHSCYFEKCGTSGEPGAGANAASIKVAWHNIGPWGDTARDKSVHATATGISMGSVHESTSTLQIVNSVFDGLGNSAAQRGVWFDLDVRDTEVSYCTFRNLNGSGVFYEGCNNGWVHHNSFTSCGNLGAINFSGGFNTSNASKYMSYGATTVAATDNVVIEDNNYLSCTVTCLLFNGARYDANSDWRTVYPVITDGRMASGSGALGTTDRSNGGSSTNTVRNNTFGTGCDLFGVWLNPQVDETTEGNMSTFPAWSGNTYPTTANQFVWGQTFQTKAQWVSAGRQ